MENQTNEQISALVDDELHGPALRQALERLRRDADLQGRWSRYHLISDTLHANLASARAAHLHQRVRAALEQEPTLLAPRRKPRLSSLAKQVAGVAIAASVAAVAILAVRQNAVEPTGVAPTAMQLAQSPRSAHELVQLASTGAPATVVVPQSANRGRLNAYLVNHNEYSASSGMQGVLPYVRIVSHETAK
ncbi:sigma-E factor negative regulatory protein [Sulfurivermis fontis]|uniref:sigma-E factor negative regulatory protein n=1 Tax=Sulfurivermis fontis TaxID=1972068 RepID=UPI000FD8F55B|nr:sigma-E factor negative regulatory protein [Sulfurivermis fontis]